MYSSVLVPFDFSPDACTVVECLREFPGVNRVVLLHVAFDWQVGGGKPGPETAADYANARLDRFRRDLRWTAGYVETRVESGSGNAFSDVVNRVAAEEGISLVAIGKRGLGVIETLLVGSSAAEIVRYGRQDVLLVHAPAGPGDRTDGGAAPCSGLFSRVLVCTDFSAPEVAEICAATLPPGAPLTLFHVVESGESLEEVRDRCAAARARLEDLAAAISGGRAPVGVSVRAGDAASEILRYADEADVGLIVVKSGGRRGLLHAILGGTSTVVVRNADRPVLLLRHPRGSPHPEQVPVRIGE
jgi:nucleotide-binding universal stress UspA family protein